MVSVQEYFLHGQNRVVSLASTGWTGRERSAYVATIAASVCGDPAIRSLGQMAGARTHRRRDLLSDREWYGTPWVCESHRSAHLDDGLYSARPVDGGTLTEGIGLHRTWGDRPFTEEDRELLHLLNLEGPRLFRARKLAILDQVGRSLPRRQVQTLERLCRGASKKEIALELGLSLNTVNTYVKALYRFFGVTTRAELLVRCLGDAVDR